MWGFKNELANAKNHITNLNISLDNERIKVFCVQQETENVLNNKKNAYRWQMEIMNRTLNDERTACQQQQAELVNIQRKQDDARRNVHH